MNNEGLKILVIEDSPTFEGLIEYYLSLDTTTSPPVIRKAATLKEGIELAEAEQDDVIFLDLGLPDSDGLQTLLSARKKILHTPIIVLTALDDEKIGLEAIHNGAQDYILKSEAKPAKLARAIRYSIERFWLQEQLRELSLTDELTGLDNRRSFMSHAEQHMKYARREGKAMLLCFMDLDGLKLMNDIHGHEWGDKAICAAAETIKASVRDSDIVSRFGGDEFVVLLTAYDDGLEKLILTRLEDNAKKFTAEFSLPRPIGVSCGYILVRPSEKLTLSQWMEIADQDLYARKKVRKAAAAAMTSANKV